ncbi:hypothetical protein ILUMI_15992 [Ignelater luminosus]|uniref:Uncharacterized protein n=1 Tax=Ignelater luminosus TaxID=2038154 RepID=A0A8K0CR63_IGNLU|nr:hypothetical protein ILUMI_15992 [Ignelater luminosus]
MDNESLTPGAFVLPANQPATTKAGKPRQRMTRSNELSSAYKVAESVAQEMESETHVLEEQQIHRIEREQGVISQNDNFETELVTRLLHYTGTDPNKRKPIPRLTYNKKNHAIVNKMNAILPKYELRGRHPNMVQQQHVNMEKSCLWLPKGELYSKTEGFVVAIQIQQYIDRHDDVAKIIHSQLTLLYGLAPKIEPYQKYHPSPPLENGIFKLYYNNPVLTDKTVSANRPDLMLINKTEKHAYMIEISIPNTHNLLQKHQEKIVPAILSVTGIIPNTLPDSLKTPKVIFDYCKTKSDVDTIDKITRTQSVKRMMRDDYYKKIATDLQFRKETEAKKFYNRTRKIARSVFRKFRSPPA